MKTKYFSYAQAYAITKDYRHLCGQHINGAAVNIITPAPYSRILQWQFARRLLDGDPVDSLLMQVADGRYDVVAITLTQKESWPFVITDIRSLLMDSSTPIDLTRYRCLRSYKAPFAEVRALLDK